MVSILKASSTAGRFARLASSHDWYTILSQTTPPPTATPTSILSPPQPPPNNNNNPPHPLHETTPTTIMVKRSPSRYFMYADPPSKTSRQQRRRDRRRNRRGGGRGGSGGASDSPPSSDSSSSFKTPELIPMTPHKLLDLCSIIPPPPKHDHNECHYYYTSPVANLCPSTLSSPSSPLSDWQSLLPPSPSSPSSSPPPQPHPSLWIGSPLSQTQCHYDVSDNVLVQLSGYKRIRVWDPTVHWEMHVFPDSHARARKGQFPVDADGKEEGEEEVYPLRERLVPPHTDVILAPGDGIRLKAFWFHHVEVVLPPTVTTATLYSSSSSEEEEGERIPPSISLNVFSNDGIVSSAAVCLSRPIPGQLLYDRHDDHHDDSDCIVDELGLPNDDHDEYGNLTNRFVIRLLRLWKQLQIRLELEQEREDVNHNHDDDNDDSLPSLSAFRKDFLTHLWLSRFNPLVTEEVRREVSDALFQKRQRLNDDDDDDDSDGYPKVNRLCHSGGGGIHNKQDCDDDEDLDIIVDDLRNLHNAILSSYRNLHHDDDDDGHNDDDDDDRRHSDGNTSTEELGDNMAVTAAVTNGIMEIVVAHLIESWIVRAWDGDSSRVEPIVRRLVLLDGGGGGGGGGDGGGGDGGNGD